MPISGSSYSGPREITYLFIDGGYLRAVMEKFQIEIFGGTPIQLDYRQLSGGFTKIFYYDCEPARRTQETDDEYNNRLKVQQMHFNNLRSLPGWHVFEGILKQTKKKVTQKEVDILIAVDLLTHTYRRNMHRVTFIAGDRDFRPLIEAVVREGMFIEVMYERASASAELIAAADSRLPIDPWTIYGWLEQKIQRAHPFPKRSSHSGKYTPVTPPIRKGITSGGEVVELFESDGQFLIIQTLERDEDFYLQVSHSDRGVLEAVHVKTYGPVTWKDVC